MAAEGLDEMGGSEVVDKVVNRFYERVVSHDELGKYFENAPVDRIKSMQRQLFGIAFGEPLEYTGAPLGEVHKGMKISPEILGLFIEQLTETLEEFSIGGEHAKRFVDRIATYSNEVMGESNVDG